MSTRAGRALSEPGPRTVARHALGQRSESGRKDGRHSDADTVFGRTGALVCSRQPNQKDRRGCCVLVDDLGVVVTPGPGVLYTVAAAISRGRRESLIAALGCTLGIIPHLLAAITGLAALLYASSVAFQTLKYAGVAYLFLLAWRAYRDDSHVVIDEVAEIESPPVWSVIVKAVLISLLNPKLTIFFFAFLPQFVHPDEPNAVLRMLASARFSCW